MKHSTLKKKMLASTRLGGFLAALLLGVTLSPVSAADPPPWAPAYGYRHKHGHHHRHEYDHEREHEYEDHDDDGRRYRPAPHPAYYDANVGISRGTCNRDKVGALLGGAVGGVVGSQFGKGDGKLASTAAGAVLGFLVGQSIGRSMDRADVFCTGRVLERAPDHHTVAWRDPDTQARYAVTPIKTYHTDGRYCREYVTKSTIGGRVRQVYGRACRNPDGSWQAVN